LGPAAFDGSSGEAGQSERGQTFSITCDKAALFLGEAALRRVLRSTKKALR